MLVHGGGVRGTGTLTKLRKVAAVTEAKSVELKAWEVAGFVTAEVRSHGGRIDKEAAQSLVSAVGTRPAQPRRRCRPAQPRRRRRTDHRGGGEALLRRQGRGQVLRDRRRRVPRAQPGGSRGAALGDGDRGALDVRHLGVRRLGPGAGPLPLGGQERPRGRPGPRGRACRPGSSRTSRPRPRAGPTTGWPGRSGPSPRRTPTSRARRATRRTRSSGWCSRSPACGRAQVPEMRSTRR